MTPVRTGPFQSQGRILALCLVLLPLAADPVSAAGSPAKKGGAPPAAHAVEKSCWTRHSRQVQDGIKPILLLQDSMSRQVALRKHSLMTQAMQKQGITDRMKKNRPAGGAATASQKAEEKALLDEIRELESRVGKDPGLLRMVENLRIVESSMDSSVAEILRTDPACAGLDRPGRRGMADRAIREFREQAAKSPQAQGRKPVRPGRSPGESK